MWPDIHPIASSRFLLSTTYVTEGVITTRSNEMKFRLDKMHKRQYKFELNLNMVIYLRPRRLN